MPKDKSWKQAFWGGLCLACTQVLAQPVMPALQGQRTLGELIDAIKAQREAVLIPGPAPASPSPSPSSSSATHQSRQTGPMNFPEQLPKLWSVTGMNGRLTAVLVDNGKVYTLDSENLPIQVGGWRVSQMDPSAIVLRQQGRVLRLIAPHSASTAHGFYWMEGGK